MQTGAGFGGGSMIKELYRMAVFAKVVERGSFSAASEALGLGKSVVSAHVQALEKTLGVQLLNRSTRSVSLTEAGRHFLEPCQRITREVEAAFFDMEAQRHTPRGTVRITAPYNLGLTLLIPLLHRFRAENPLVQVDLVLEDGITNMIAEGYDLALRVGWLSDSRLHAVRLAPMELIVCGSAAYFQRFPKPMEPEDLVHHPWVAISLIQQATNLPMETEDGRRKSIRLKPSILVNSGVAACEFVRCGSGLGLLPDYAVAADLAAGRVVRALPHWRTKPGSISAVYPHQDRMPPKLRVLLDFMKAEFGRLQAQPPLTPD